MVTTPLTLRVMVLILATIIMSMSIVTPMATRATVLRITFLAMAILA